MYDSYEKAEGQVLCGPDDLDHIIPFPLRVLRTVMD